MAAELKARPRDISAEEITRRASERYQALTSGMLWALGFPGEAHLRYRLCVAIRARWREAQTKTKAPGPFA